MAKNLVVVVVMSRLVSACCCAAAAVNSFVHFYTSNTAMSLSFIKCCFFISYFHVLYDEQERMLPVFFPPPVRFDKHTSRQQHLFVVEIALVLL